MLDAGEFCSGQRLTISQARKRLQVLRERQSKKTLSENSFEELSQLKKNLEEADPIEDFYVFRLKGNNDSEGEYDVTT